MKQDTNQSSWAISSINHGCLYLLGSIHSKV